MIVPNDYTHNETLNIQLIQLSNHYSPCPGLTQPRMIKVFFFFLTLYAKYNINLNCKIIINFLTNYILTILAKKLNYIKI
jgi:hypothetical protein